MTKTIYASLLAVSLMLFSCSKKDPVDPGSQSASAKELETKIQGKWTFNNISISKSSSVSKNRGVAGLKGKGTMLGLRKSLNNMANRVSESPNPGNANTGFIEFLSDNTYLIYDSEGNFFTGKFEAKDGTTITLNDFGSISEIKFVQQRIDFKIAYTAANKTLTVSANKAADVPVSDKAKLLCGNSWYVTLEENGKELLEKPIDVYDNNGNFIEEVVIDRATVLFSVSGTYVVQFYKAGKLIKANMANWKWHSKDANKFVYWWYDDEIDEDNDFVTLRELTKDVLKTQESWTYNDGTRDITEVTNMVLRPVK